MTDGPVVIGGTGGSGTRVVARLLARAGWFLGARLNGSHDALDIAEFDARFGPRLVRDGPSDELRAAFERALSAHLRARPADAVGWGWKHPQSYLLLELLAERLPGLRFVHVLRDGRDIALARNDNQLRLYGDAALGPGDAADPVRRIAFWAWANERASSHCAALLGERSIALRLEDLCRAPEPTTRRLLAFAGAGAEAELALEEIVAPASLGRGRRADPALVERMEAAAGEALRRFGYLEDR